MPRTNISYLYLMPTAAARTNDTVGWTRRHFRAINTPKTEFENAYVSMLRAWLEYADAHYNTYSSPIGDDCVLGPEWARIGAGLRGLLNGDVGELDAGTLDSIVAAVLRDHDFDPDEL